MEGSLVPAIPIVGALRHLIEIAGKPGDDATSFASVRCHSYEGENSWRFQSLMAALARAISNDGIMASMLPPESSHR